MATSLPDKLFFRIGEVADLVGVKPHVLRYWESEFPVLRPMKTGGSHRQYRRRDVELAMLIRQLLHDEGYTISGARKQLKKRGLLRRSTQIPEAPRREVLLRAALLEARAELLSLREALDRMSVEAEEADRTPTQVKVYGSVPVPASVRARARTSKK